MEDNPSLAQLKHAVQIFARVQAARRPSRRDLQHATRIFDAARRCVNRLAEESHQ